jgi:hypothetical protein
MAAAIRRMAGVAPLTVITGRALADLAEELGSMDGAVGWLLELARDIGRPVAARSRSTCRRASAPRAPCSCRRGAGRRSD